LYLYNNCIKIKVSGSRLDYVKYSIDFVRRMTSPRSHCPVVLWKCWPRTVWD